MSSKPAANSWLTPTVVLQERLQSLTVLIPADSREFLPLIADGYVDVPVIRPGRAAKPSIAMLRFADWALQAELTSALLADGTFSSRSSDEACRLHCRDAWWLPGEQKLAVTLDAGVAGVPSLISPDVIGQAVTLVTLHRARQAARAAEDALAELDDQALLDRMPADRRRSFEAARGTAAVARAAQAERPPVAPKEMLLRLRHGLATRARSADPDVVERAALTVIRKAPQLPDYLPPREGLYRGWVDRGAQRGAVVVLVTWSPHRGMPPYPEVRAAAARRLPKAFAAPRMGGLQPPAISDLAGPSFMGHDGNAIEAASFDPRDPSWLDAFKGKEEFDFPNRADMAASARADIQQRGFEALAWYQAHHLFTEDAWGIYVDAAKLDELTCSLSQDLRLEGIRGGVDALAAKLAVGLVLEHEHFHAKLEAALTWAELHAGHGKYRRYKSGVYAALRGTDAWLEEALANYWSWTWFSTETMLAELGGILAPAQREAMTRVVDAVLDLAPAGYRRWRDGRDREVWRTLATQAMQGRPGLLPPGIGLPLEPSLREALPFDYHATDVPLRFVGHGQVAHRLLSSPATLNRPSRRELRRALMRHYGYAPVPGGKGSHEKFKGSNGQMFPLPQRDPVSQDVFSAFLDHFQISKTEYIQNIRPTL